MRVVGKFAWLVCTFSLCACSANNVPQPHKQTGNVPVASSGGSSNAGSGAARLDASTQHSDAASGFTDGGSPLDGDAALGVVTGPGMLVAEPHDDAAFLWDDSAPLRTFELTIAQTDLDTINANPAAEAYVPATFKLGSETVSAVGVRYKGSVGAFVGCTTSANPLMPSGAKTCAKLSMKVAFDFQDDNGRFHGLKKLNFHSMNEDDSLLRDRLGYAMYRAMNLAAPRCGHARLLINGKLAGLFALVEEIDGRFTDSRFTARGDGNLYKEVWPKWEDPATYTPGLRTNRGNAAPPVERVTRFAGAVNAAADDSAVNVLADQWLDMRYVMDFVAVDRATLNDDGMFHWYCNSNGLPVGNNPGPCSSHNYYWYEEAGWDRLWPIEWDVTLSFRGETSGFITILDPWDEAAPACTPKPGGSTFGPQQLPPSCDKLTHAWGSRGADYKAAILRFVNGPYAKANVDAKLAAWSAQIADAVDEAAAAGQTPDATTWQSAKSSLVGTIDDLRSAAQQRAQ